MAGLGTGPTNHPGYITTGARVNKYWALSSSSRRRQAAQSPPDAARVVEPERLAPRRQPHCPPPPRLNLTLHRRGRGEVPAGRSTVAPLPQPRRPHNPSPGAPAAPSSTAPSPLETTLRLHQHLATSNATGDPFTPRLCPPFPNRCRKRASPPGATGRHQSTTTSPALNRRLPLRTFTPLPTPHRPATSPP